jgi:hypothetical protein
MLESLNQDNEEMNMQLVWIKIKHVYTFEDETCWKATSFQ